MSAVQPSAVRPEPEAARTTRASRTVIISAWAVPVLVVGQFAMLAVVPVVLVLIGAFRDARLRASGGRAMQGWAIALAVTYAVPLVLRATGPTPGLSLSKSMSPVVAALAVAVSVAVAVALAVIARRGSASVRDGSV